MGQLASKLYEHRHEPCGAPEDEDHHQVLSHDDLVTAASTASASSTTAANLHMHHASLHSHQLRHPHLRNNTTNGDNNHMNSIVNTRGNLTTMSIFKNLSAKQYLIEARYPRLPTNLEVAAPRKIQRVSKMRLYVPAISVSVTDDLRVAIRDFVQTLEGPGLAEGDVGVETLLLLLETDICDMLDSCHGTYVQETFSVPMYLHNALARLDVVVGALGSCNNATGMERGMVGAYYVGDIAFIDLKPLSFPDIFYLTDRALFFRNGDATRWVVIAKLFCRMAALQRAADGELQGGDRVIDEFIEVRQSISDEYGLL